MNSVATNVSITCVDTIFSNSMRMNAKLVSQNLNIKVVFVWKRLANQFITSRSLLNEPSVKGDDIVAILVKIKFLKKWKYARNRTASRNNDLYPSSLGILNCLKDFRCDLTLAIQKSSININCN